MVNKGAPPDPSQSLQVRNKVVVEKAFFSFKKLNTLVVKVISFCPNPVISVMLVLHVRKVQVSKLF